MRLIDKDALRAIALRRSSSPADATLSVNDLDAAESVCCGKCTRYDVTSFCSLWERCSYPDDGCSCFTSKEAT